MSLAHQRFLFLARTIGRDLLFIVEFLRNIALELSSRLRRTNTAFIALKK